MTGLDDARGNFEFMKACAQRLGVPHAEHWELVFDPEKAWPYRVVDTAVAPVNPTDAVAFVLLTRAPRQECEAIGRVFRGLWQLRETGSTSDLLCRARRRDTTTLPEGT